MARPPDGRHIGSGPGTLARRSLVLPAAVALLVFGLYPLVFTVLAALSDSSLGRPFRGWVGLAHFSELVQNADIRAGVLRTVLYAFGVATLSLLLGLLTALALFHNARRGALVRTLLLLPLIVPPVIVGSLWKLMFNPGGGLLATVLARLGVHDASPTALLASTTWALPTIALADVWEWSPLVALLVFAALLAQDHEVLEAAELDGAHGWARFRHITLPAIAGTLAAAFFIRLVLAFKLFDLVFITTSGGPGQATTTTAYAIYQLALRSFDVGRAAALTLLLAVLITLIAVPLAGFTRRLNATHG